MITVLWLLADAFLKPKSPASLANSRRLVANSWPNRSIRCKSKDSMAKYYPILHRHIRADSAQTMAKEWSLTGRCIGWLEFGNIVENHWRQALATYVSMSGVLRTASGQALVTPGPASGQQ